MVVLEHIADAANTFNFDVSIIEPTSRRRLIHSRKRQNKGYCESDVEKNELFALIREQLVTLTLQEQEMATSTDRATAANAVGKNFKSSA